MSSELNGDVRVIIETINKKIDSEIKIVMKTSDDTNSMVRSLHSRIDKLFELNACNDKNINGVEIKYLSIQAELTEFKSNIAEYKKCNPVQVQFDKHIDDHDKKENKIIASASLIGGAFAWLITFLTKKL